MVTSFPVIGLRMVMAVLPVQAGGERRACGFDQGGLGLWLRDSYCTGTLIAKAGEARIEHLACSMEDADPTRYKRISQSMVAAAWLTAY
jgi:hypothetical protein